MTPDRCGPSCAKGLTAHNYFVLNEMARLRTTGVIFLGATVTPVVLPLVPRRAATGTASPIKGHSVAPVSVAGTANPGGSVPAPRWVPWRCSR